jgi:hypothetical protein
LQHGAHNHWNRNKFVGKAAMKVRFSDEIEYGTLGGNWDGGRQALG